MVKERDDASIGPLRSLLARLVDPSEDWAQRGEERKPSALMVYAAVLLGILLLVAVLSTRIAEDAEGVRGLLTAVWIALGLAAAIVILLAWQIRRHFLDPLANLYTWALGMCDGDLSSRIASKQPGRFAKLTFHINRLSEALEKLANEMDDVVWQQTRRLQQRNKSLEMLFEVASAINTTANLTELLNQSAEIVMPIVKGIGCVVRLREEDGEVYVLGTGVAAQQPVDVPINDPAFKVIEALLDGGRHDQRVDIHQCKQGDGELSIVTVPMHYQGKNLGLLSIFTPVADSVDEEEAHKLLVSIGKHLGMAIAKSRLDEESHNLTLMRERTSLAHELHDSLAQSLAGLRFQVKLLGDTLDGEDALQGRRELRRINNSMDGLNTELRELIANFRAPMDERGLLPALEGLVDRFGRSSGISAHLHTECTQLRLPATAEMQVLGVVREALTNARKHSQAKTVRLLLRCESVGDYTLLVEDDGVGNASPTAEADQPGEHVGLLIMEERAKRLGGELRIESEPGEGTRVELRFSASPEEQDGEVRASAR
ncbi:MAG: histidine kinase [Gammaproteobacteria bacterium]|nr:histidine kinase [Gammaproteobacteria bacterium]MDX2461651.1 histidine kinase [Gammaproteobacteria bacterium]